MDVPLTLSLTRAASVTLASSLWNRQEIIADIKNHIVAASNCKTWPVIEKDVANLLEQSAFPPVIKVSLKNLVKLMGAEVCRWISIARPSFLFASRPPEFLTFVWSKSGIFDTDQTAKLIMKWCSDEVLRFCLSCTFAFEQTVYELWPHVHEYMSEKMTNSPYKYLSMPIACWMGYLNKNIPGISGFFLDFELRSCNKEHFYDFAFLEILYADPRCVSSINYFLMQETPEDRRKRTVSCLEFLLKPSRPRDRHLVICLLNKLPKCDVDQIVKENCYGVLYCFLLWPYTELLLPLLDSNWKHLSELDYVSLLEDMFECSSELCKDNVYKHFTKQVWRSTPPPFKRYIIKKCLTGSLLSRLFRFENTDDLMQLIFDECNAKEKQLLIFQIEGMNLCDLLVKKGRWGSLKVFIKSCLPSKALVEKFICDYQKYRPYYYNEETKLRTIAMVEKVNEWFCNME